MAGKNVLAVVLACLMAGQPGMGMGQQSAPQQQPALPDGPKPQIIPDAPRPQTLGPVTPGKGTTPETNGDSSSGDAQTPAKPQAAQKQEEEDQGPPPDTTSGPSYVLHVQTNYVEIPFTVKDNKGNQVAGLTWRDIRVYENNRRMQLTNFTVDPFPLSVALVIDQSVQFDIMAKVNNSLAAMQGAFSPFDEVAVFTYNNGPKMVTNFTAGQSARLVQALEQSKTGGREMAYIPGGGLGQNIYTNDGADHYIDPNTNSTHGRSQLGINNPPREVHTLNDAILKAGEALSKTKTGRRRVIYVVSNGNEYGSKAKYSEVVKYLNTNKIAVFGTLVGDSALWGVGFLDRMHLPLMMRDNILPAYATSTGGYFMGEYRQGGIEQSFAKIAEEVRTQYTVGYYTHEPFIDGKYRNIEVKVLRPNLNVIAKKGYWPTAQESTAPGITPAAR